MKEEEKGIFEFALKNFPRSTASDILKNMGKKVIAFDFHSNENEEEYKRDDTKYRIVCTYLLSEGTLIRIEKGEGKTSFSYSSYKEVG